MLFHSFVFGLLLADVLAQPLHHGHHTHHGHTGHHQRTTAVNAVSSVEPTVQTSDVEAAVSSSDVEAPGPGYQAQTSSVYEAAASYIYSDSESPVYSASASSAYSAPASSAYPSPASPASESPFSSAHRAAQTAASSGSSSGSAGTAGLNGHVGPLTALSAKTHVCSIEDYGAVSGNTSDISSAINDAFSQCVSGTPNSVLLIPEGQWLLTSPVTLSGGSAWALQIDGLISCAYSTSSWSSSSYNTAIVVKNTNDFEMFSSNGQGAIQGLGYVYRTISGQPHDESWVRLVRLVNVQDASIHDLFLIDSPMYHLVVFQSTNVEVYHITIRGGNTGLTDGIDISGTNYYVHDVEVTNKDECVCVKSPSQYGEISNIYCSNSGGVSIGSLQQDAAVSNIRISNVQNYYTNGLMFIKTKPGGSGYVRDCEFSNFQGYDCAYGINIDQYWDSSSRGSGGVQLENLSFSDFSGSINAAYSGDSPTRGAVRIIGASDAPPQDISIDNIVMYKDESVNGMFIDVYQNAEGTGGYLESSGDYTTSVTATATPSGWTQPTLPAWNVGTDGYGLSAEIPVYTPPPIWS